jgi:cell fate regulator YaaT (PSP1 superfamily)
LPLHIGSVVTVESNPGHDIGVVSLTGELVKIQMKKKHFSEDAALKIYRVATQKDVEIWQDARKKEDQTKIQARKIAKNLGLEMKITDVEYQGDGSKATFYYTAEGRVDFRQLIKEYASSFKTKIDMKQIGYRQESAKVGGIGSCGRELCCSTWLTDFRSVNTNAARYQQLSINPLKLAGQCGKLKCCLNFELDSYVDALSDFPSSNTIIETEKGRAFCIKIDVFKKKMWFAYVDNSMAWYDLDVAEVKKMMKINSKGQKSIPLEELKTFTGADKVETVDLIQENNLDRFEKKKPNKHRNKNTGNNRAEQVTKEPEAQKDNNKPEKSNAPKKFNKNKKRFPPKRNNND